MSIRFRNSCRLATASNTVIGYNKNQATLAFLFRINGPISQANYGTAVTYFLSKTGTNGLLVRCASVDDAAQTMRVQFGWRANNNTALHYTPTLYPDVVYAVVMTYDKDVPGSQALWLNGIKFQLAPTQSVPLDNDGAAFEIGTAPSSGSFTRDFNLDRIMWWNDWVASASDVEAIMDGTADPTNAGLSATWRDYWTLFGTTGGTPTNGDGALSGQVTNDWPLLATVVPAVSGSSLTYEDPLVFTPQTAVGTPIVASSGKSIIVKPTTPGGLPLRVAGLGETLPTVSIDGGTPFEVARAFAERHDAAIFYFPEGEAATESSVVTFSADQGFLTTALGVAPECVDLACDNRTNRAIYGATDKTMRLGLNYDDPGSAYYSFSQGPANWWLRLLLDHTQETSSTIRDDGTLKVNRSNILMNDTASFTEFDYHGFPSAYGKWVLSYVPLDAGRETDISFNSAASGTITELTDYRNNGSAPGDRVTKVYEMLPASGIQFANTLAAAVTTTDQTEITLTLGTNIQSAAMAGNPIYFLQVGSERMEVRSWNSSTKVATVIRGVLGTTATTHSDGADCFTERYIHNGGIRVTITGPGGVPNYAPDVTVYCPDDWTPPTPAAPVTDLDCSFEARIRPSKFYRDSMPYAGTCRYMASTGAFLQLAEPEHLRRATDPYWGFRAKFKHDFRIAEERPFDPVDTPYAYVHFGDFPGAETYTATLASAISTAPASETPYARAEEVITISDAATAPILPGSRLFVGSEQMRVVAVDGTDVTVVRGTMGTSTSTHSTGSITVGWRVPLDDTSQYELADRVAITIETDVPHLLRTGMWNAYPLYLDMNPLARMTVTLAEDIVAEQTTFQITADPEDWHYIRTGLYVNFGSNNMRLSSADSTTGVISVEVGPTSAHSAGTTGNTFCVGAFCRAKDESGVYAWSPNQASGIYPIVTGANTLLVSATVVLGGKVGVVDSAQPWDQTARMSGSNDQSQIHYKFPVSKYPYDWTAILTSESPGAYHWLNVPMLASDDMIRDIAVQLYSRLPTGAGHRIVVEMGNEQWHPIFPFLNLNPRISALAGYGTNIYAWPVVRARQATDLINAVRVELGHDADALCCLPGQMGAVDRQVLVGEALGIYGEVATCAPYWKPWYTTAIRDAFNAIDDDQAIDTWVFDYIHNLDEGTPINLRVDAAKIAAYKARTGRDIEWICYEGGTSSYLPRSATLPTNGVVDTGAYQHGVEREYDLNYNPTLRHALHDLLYYNQSLDMDGYHFYDHSHWPHKYDMGSGFFLEFWGLTHYHGQPAGRGDDSDGKGDNRQNLAYPDQPGTIDPLANYAGSNVSVKLQSFLDWNYERANPAPAEHNPLPRTVQVPISRRRKTRLPSLYRIPREHVIPPPAADPRPRRLPVPNHRRRPLATPVMFRIAQESGGPPPTPTPPTLFGRRVIVHRLLIS